ncbi:type II toxin-antitoxin system RelE/ParE family toxin [Pseudomonas sp. NPDC098747]|uniref:type II toxin-antitoxin system RelE/ParE family toxin n=1 Tax=Pseudomonas sp. NPDC098747 TaxID=3364487 RepID=UPI00383AC107
MIVHLTDEAEGDLERIGDYIAQDNPQRALSFVLELRDKCLSLASTYQSFPLISRYALRRRVHGHYAIFYQIEADRVVVVHVLHGAMDYAAIFIDSE